MPKGVIKLTKTAKGKIIVSLDRLNGKPPVPLSYVSFPDDKLNDKPCEYETGNGGLIISIKVEDKIVFGANFAKSQPPVQQPIQERQNMGTVQPVPQGVHPVYGNGMEDSMSNINRESKLPKTVRNLPLEDIENFSLKYNKAARFINDAPGKNKFFFFKNDWRRRKDGSEAGHKFFIKPNYGSLNFEGIAARQSNQVNRHFKESKQLRFAPDWRLICGLSGGIYETNITLHHIYGVPYIPASSLKGVVRSWIIANIFDKPEQGEEEYPMKNAEYRALKNSILFCDLFGSPESIERVEFEKGKPKKKKDKNGKEIDSIIKEKSAVGKEQQGAIVFMDGLPTNPPKLMPDIMNPHFPDWYNGNSLPTDFQNPIPVVFLTVEQSSKFQTFVGTNCKKTLDKWEDFKLFAAPVQLDDSVTLLELIYAWLSKALSEHGIGAKTAVGYGYMTKME